MTAATATHAQLVDMIVRMQLLTNFGELRDHQAGAEHAAIKDEFGPLLREFMEAHGVDAVVQVSSDGFEAAVHAHPQLDTLAQAVVEAALREVPTGQPGTQKVNDMFSTWFALARAVNRNEFTAQSIVELQPNGEAAMEAVHAMPGLFHLNKRR